MADSLEPGHDVEEQPGGLWYEWFMTDAFSAEKQKHRIFRILPHDPRCKFCHAPFSGAGALVVRTLYGKRQSTLNPRFCNACEALAASHPGGAEVQMSMLFADIRGSTPLSEQMTAGEFGRLINRFFVEASSAVVSEDGLVEKLAGDAVAAFWGPGFAGARYVDRALEAARKIRRTMEASQIPVGIGVHAGVGFFGAVGAAEGLTNITAVGEEVNTAARLAGQAAAGEIIISEQALKLTDLDSLPWEQRGLTLKGIARPVRVRLVPRA